ncbi:septum formation initiator family protein [Agrococcus sp. SL85]|uniref:FtsB family cell division protein n=1 Tax=Agrococcus sp. SL85 TaxID=2995141 RepID=UPI00226C91EC|nr:septum formation initiator family protein [Agrococcus sp. SL85]WAC65325.1 septum formation initiator family protein [Agrococcus sp. SL85]
MPSSRPDPVGQLRVSWLLLVVVGLVVAGVVVLAPTVGLLLEQRRDIAAAEAQVVEQQENVEALQDEVARWDDPAYIEAQARDRLFYVYPGETSFVLLDDRSALESASAPVPSATLEQPTRDWASAAASSFLVAGLTSAGPTSFGEPAETDTPE